MVKIEEISLERKAREKRCRTLADIARETFRGNPLYAVRETVPNSIKILTHGERPRDIYVAIGVDVQFNGVRVDNPKYFQDALKLAETYEAKTGQEFTLRKHY
ncbi:MAG: hypothetical protein Q8R47_05200 [Nanoarchaeota archaeon]|nr:hypothetical protein [Nanoarchaeota archaeon]